MDHDGQEPCTEALLTKGLFPIVDLGSTDKNHNMLNNKQLMGMICPMHPENGKTGKKNPENLKP
jgi:hypothetical protein